MVSHWQGELWKGVTYSQRPCVVVSLLVRLRSECCHWSSPLQWRAWSSAAVSKLYHACSVPPFSSFEVISLFWRISGLATEGSRQRPTSGSMCHRLVRFSFGASCGQKVLPTLSLAVSNADTSTFHAYCCQKEVRLAQGPGSNSSSALPISIRYELCRRLTWNFWFLVLA